MLGNIYKFHYGMIYCWAGSVTVIQVFAQFLVTTSYLKHCLRLTCSWRFMRESDRANEGRWLAGNVDVGADTGWRRFRSKPSTGRDALTSNPTPNRVEQRPLLRSSAANRPSPWYRQRYRHASKKRTDTYRQADILWNRRTHKLCI